MKSCIYKITRKDGLEYIGITKNLKKRLNEHKRSERFKIGITNVEILFEGEKNDCEFFEGHYIQKYDTFIHGLNNTKTGKGQNFFLTTLGYKFSEESRKKMSESAKGKHSGEKNGMFNKTHSLITRKKISQIHKGKVYHSKLTKQQVEEIRNKYSNKSLEIEKELILKKVKKTQRKEVINMKNIDFSNLISGNGSKLTYYTLFCIKISEMYNVHPNNIRRILKEETWKN